MEAKCYFSKVFLYVDSSWCQLCNSDDKICYLHLGSGFWGGSSLYVALSHVQLFAALLPVALQAPLSMGFPSQEYWSGLPFPSPGDLPDPGIESMSLFSLVLAGRFLTISAT